MSLFGAPGLQRANAIYQPSSQPQATPTPSLFGQNAATPAPGAQTQTGLFGSTPNPSAGQTGLFGASTAPKPAGTGLFGAPQAQGATGQQPQTNSLFGQPQATQPQQQPQGVTGSLFGAKPAQPASGLFGQPQAQPAATGLFGQTQQPQQQNQGLLGCFGQKPASNLFGAPQQPLAPQFLSFLEATTRATPLRELRVSDLTLSRSNPFQRKTMENLPGQAQTYQAALHIENTLNQQEKDLSEIDKAMKELGKETAFLREQIEDTNSHTLVQCHRVSQIRLQIEAMDADLHKNFSYHSQLESLIDQFNDPDKAISVPFQFFYDLYREQEKEVIKLTQKVQEAENLAEKLLQESMKRSKDAAAGNLVDCDLDQVSLRDKIFQVCTMLYEQQKRAGMNLAQLEMKVANLRQDFTGTILSKNHWETEASVNQMFQRSEELEMSRQFNQLQKRRFETNLSKNFEDSLSLIMRPKERVSTSARFSKRQETTSGKTGPKTTGSLTERLHRGTQASSRMGRRQVGAQSQLGLQNEFETSEQIFSSRLGKRTFHEVPDDKEVFGQQARQSTLGATLAMKRHKNQDTQYQGDLYRRPLTVGYMGHDQYSMSKKTFLNGVSRNSIQNDGRQSMMTCASSMQPRNSFGGNRGSFIQGQGQTMSMRGARNPLF